MTDVTQLLLAADRGDPKAIDDLLPLVYLELRQLAAAKLAKEKQGYTLQPTALVHEVYLRLIGKNAVDQTQQPSGQQWNSRAHFFGAASEAMRRILVEGARHRARLKRGGGLSREEMEITQLVAKAPDREILEIDQALTRFAQEQPQKAALVKLRYFGGFSMSEAALTLGISIATAERHWRYARARLARYVRELNEDE